MTDKKTGYSCSVCGGELSQIRIVDKGGRPIHDGHFGDTLLEYTHVDDKVSTWSHTYPKRGQVLSLMCGQCGRIFMYGVAYPDKK